MICAQCDRCGRRSILSPMDPHAEPPADGAFAAAAPAIAGPGNAGGGDAVSGEAPLRARCDLCGSRNVRVVRLASMFEAVAFVNGRLSGR